MIDDYARFDQKAYDIARLRMKDAPLQLTDADFAQLEIVSHVLANEAHRARGAAILQESNATPPAPLVTKNALPEPQSIKEWGERYATKAITGKILAKVLDDMSDAIVDVVGKVCRKRIAPLEETTKDLQARVLELEAQAAARAKVDA